MAEHRAHREQHQDHNRPERHRHRALGEKVRPQRHRAGAFHFQPAEPALHRDSHAEGVQRRAHDGERAVGRDQVARHRGRPFVRRHCQSEETVEHQGKQNRGQGITSHAGEFEKLGPRLQPVNARHCSTSSMEFPFCRTSERKASSRPPEPESAGAAPSRLISAGVPCAMMRPPIDHGDPVGQRIRLVQIVGGEQHAAAARHESANVFPHAAPRFHIQPHGGLVQEQQVGIAADGQREQQALFLSAGEFAEEALLHAAQSGGRDGLLELQRLGVIAGEQFDVLAHANRLRHARHLQHRAAAQFGRMAGRGVAEDGRPARCLRRESQQDAHRGGLARAIGTQHRQQFAALDGEIDSVQRGHRSVILRNVLQFRNRHVSLPSYSMLRQSGRRCQWGLSRARHDRCNVA